MPPFPETTTASKYFPPCADLARTLRGFLTLRTRAIWRATCVLQALPDVGSQFLLARVLARTLREFARTRAESFRKTPFSKAVLHQKGSVARGYFETIK